MEYVSPTEEVESFKLNNEDTEGKYIRGDMDKINWGETYNGYPQEKLEEIQKELDIPEEYIADIELWCEDQIKQGSKEFIRRFTSILAKSLHGYCVLRAMGYHVQIEHEGKAITSLRQMAKHFKCSHQLIHQLIKDFEKQLKFESFKTLEIETRTYTCTVEPPKGYITMGNAMKRTGMSRRKFLKYCEAKNITLKRYIRNSRILPIKSLPAN